MSVIAFEGDVLCVVSALKRTKCLGFVHLLLHDDTENLAHTIRWPVTGGARVFFKCSTQWKAMQDKGGMHSEIFGSFAKISQNASGIKDEGDVPINKTFIQGRR
jgi:hypothetical protein